MANPAFQQTLACMQQVISFTGNSSQVLICAELSRDVRSPAVRQARLQRAASRLLPTARPAGLRGGIGTHRPSRGQGAVNHWRLRVSPVCGSKASGSCRVPNSVGIGKAGGKMLPACLTSSVREKIIPSQTL